MEKDDEVKGGGNSYDFGARMYDSRVGRWWSVDSHASNYVDWTPYKYALNSPLNWIDIDGNDEFPTWADYKYWAQKNNQPVLRRSDMHQQGHWLAKDRFSYFANGTSSPKPDCNSAVYYRMANYRNLLKQDASHYHNLEDRMMFYSWCSDYMDRKGHKVKWMKAATETVGTLTWGLSPLASLTGFANSEIQVFIQEGNKIILDDMISKIKDLDNISCSLGEKQAFMWDAQALADEQNLIQPKYETLSTNSKEILQSNFKNVLGAEGNVLDKADRWVYGMSKMGYNVTKDMMPEAGSNWKDYDSKERKDENKK